MTSQAPALPDLSTDPGFAGLRDFVIEATGLAYYADKEDDFSQRIARRMQATQQADCTAYLASLMDQAHGEVELGRLVEELTVGETSFFRHRELFDGLRDQVLPDLIARNHASRRLRIWSAGCSTGAEPYSLAILLARAFGSALQDWDISILGTDINRGFLRRAAEGEFRSWDFRGTDRGEIEGCFTRRGDAWVIRPEHRRWVTFAYHNLVRAPFPSLLDNLIAFDLILCRNVLIYFSRPIVQQLVHQFHACLVDGGWLLVGHAEPNVELFRSFETVNICGAAGRPNAVCYRRNDSTAPPAPAANEITVPARPPQPQPPGRRVPPARQHHNMPASRAAADGGHAAAANLTEVLRLADRGDLQSSVRRCALLVAKDPLNPALHLHLAMLAEQLGDHDKAETSLRRTLYLRPNDALAHYLLGLVQQKRGRRLEAEQSYRNALDCLDGQADDEPVCGEAELRAADLREMTRAQQEATPA